MGTKILEDLRNECMKMMDNVSEITAIMVKTSIRLMRIADDEYNLEGDNINFINEEDWGVDLYTITSVWIGEDDNGDETLMFRAYLANSTTSTYIECEWSALDYYTQIDIAKIICSKV